MAKPIKVAILGCRGIPNHYGGFGQLAEYISVRLVDMGMDVSVYNVHNHPYQEKTWKGVNIIHCYDAEPNIGTAGQFIYDLNCIWDSRKRNFDVIIQLGYTSSTIWWWLMPKRTKIATNMDGLEWKRSKYSKPVQQFLKVAEWLGAITSDQLIADSPAIQDYLLKKFKKNSSHIAYGGLVFDNPNERFLEEYQLEPFTYNMLVARMEPENHIEEIIKGHLYQQEQILLVVGNTHNAYGKRLLETYGSHPQIRFTQGIYDLEALNNLRYFSHLYFHGHSVGGTNPSLIEAMASGALICAHSNPFNEAILNKKAFYFETPTDIEKLLSTCAQKDNYQTWIDNNKDAVREKYSWDKIAHEYAKVITELVG